MSSGAPDLWFIQIACSMPIPLEQVGLVTFRYSALNTLGILTGWNHRQTGPHQVVRFYQPARYAWKYALCFQQSRDLDSSGFRNELGYLWRISGPRACSWKGLATLDSFVSHICQALLLLFGPYCDPEVSFNSFTVLLTGLPCLRCCMLQRLGYGLCAIHCGGISQWCQYIIGQLVQATHQGIPLDTHPVSAAVSSMLSVVLFTVLSSLKVMGCSKSVPDRSCREVLQWC